MSAAEHVVIAEPLTAETWAPFGWVPRRDSDPKDGDDRLSFAWQDVHVNFICHRADELPCCDDGMWCQMMFHHRTHTQALCVLNCRAVIAVAPAERKLQAFEDLESIRAFVLEPHAALVIAPGVWHWGPFPIDQPQVDLFNVQGLRYAEDNARADLASIAQVRVLTSPGSPQRAPR